MLLLQLDRTLFCEAHVCLICLLVQTGRKGCIHRLRI